MKKKLIALVLLLVINIVLIMEVMERTTAAPQEEQREEVVQHEEVVEELPSIETAIPLQQPDVQAETTSELVYDVETKEILYGNNIDTPLGIASVTKMMTQYILMEQLEEGTMTLQQTVTLSPHFFEKYQINGLASASLVSGGTYTVDDLMRAVSTVSANDAAIGLAEALGGTEAQFVQMMNEHAKRFGMTNTTYDNATGLTMPNEYNRSSARDLANLAERLLTEYPEVLTFTSLRSHTMPNGFVAKTTNLALPGEEVNLSYIDGLKTGYTIEAGQNFVGTGTIEGRRFIVVLQNWAPDRPLHKTLKFERTAELVEQYVRPHFGSSSDS